MIYKRLFVPTCMLLLPSFLFSQELDETTRLPGPEAETVLVEDRVSVPGPEPVAVEDAAPAPESEPVPETGPVFQPPVPMTVEEFIASRNKFRVNFDEGATASWVTRIIKQSGRSNFVFEDFLAGLYFTVRTNNFDSLVPFPLPVEVLARVAACYPLTHHFNDYPQKAVNVLNFGVDFILAPVLQINFLDYLYFDLGTGLHFLYQKADRWHYVHLGAVGMVGFQLPLARRWTLTLNGYASIDNGNLGSNRHMEPYDIVWQYQASIGVRYSKNSPNPKTYIPTKMTDVTEYESYLRKYQKKEAKAAEKAEKARPKAMEE